jgi:hypothetical protein
VAQGETIKTLESNGFFPKEPDRVVQRVQSTNSRISFLKDKPESKGSRASLVTQQHMLLQREKNALIRSPAPMIANVCITALLALVFGVIFFGVGKESRTDLLVSPSFSTSSSSANDTYATTWAYHTLFAISFAGCPGTVRCGSECPHERYDGTKSNCLDYFLFRTSGVSERVLDQSLYDCSVLSFQVGFRGLAVLCCHDCSRIDCLLYDWNSNELLSLFSPVLCTRTHDYCSLRIARKLLYRSENGNVTLPFGNRSTILFFWPFYRHQPYSELGEVRTYVRTYVEQSMHAFACRRVRGGNTLFEICGVPANNSVLGASK